MAKNFHEIRDPIHIFVRMDSDERKVLDSAPFQRLRHIHQLALTYLIYPGATHRRFEHSVGVMELASRIFDVVTHDDNISDPVKELIPEIRLADSRNYWRRVLRMAALCHDMGHLPFSHAAEDLLPAGIKHEAITAAIVRSEVMKGIWESMTPPLRVDDVVKLALGPKEAKDLKFSTWEAILAEIIVGDAFGADRMDYLLRDSYHAGVAYGRFDHYRLIDTLRILPSPPRDEKRDGHAAELGVEEGGLRSAEALMLARYFMYSQLYFHQVRRIYNEHLMDFLRAWLPGGKFDTSVQAHLTLTDNEVNSNMALAARDSSHPAHDPARRIVERDHFRLIYERNPDDVRINPRAGESVFLALKKEFDEKLLKYDFKSGTNAAPDFPVRMHDSRIVSSMAVSETLPKLPVPTVDFVFADRSLADQTRNFIKEQRQRILEIKED